MKHLILRLLMKLSHSLAPKDTRVNKELMDDWIKALSSDSSGYRSYYTIRKRAIQNGFVSGMSQENYWFNCGRLIELQYLNALSIRLIKEDKKYAIKKGEVEEDN